MRFPAAMNQVVSTLAIAIGIFFSATPERAAKIWGRRDLNALAHGGLYRRLYRAAGVMLCLAGLLLAFEDIWSRR